ncbi:Bug family tripartite tricarboxylate transporter substrate binding protein [Aquabacter spiritensis]|uniref:Tripartite-type tricarboxylate transporter receptor subunit TctC n=1 Tax=Aquabacter spiritensis TaxID=933073 RepID=A0A4R3M4F5_9HYPH|nr:tripartite tricarboxylate transporter substrate binding protein [Aquabacter spiritensis]TCT06065.1 tripartite-type tricarboxylate transporter receptor subunit TctC [Aquabacter spiritensis]
MRMLKGAPPRRAGRLMPRLLAAGLALVMTAGAFVGRAAADWPDRPITVVVHFAPGGSNDLLGRLIASELGPVLGQSVVVVNKPGANGDIGVSFASRATPDGYTLLVASGSALVNPATGKVSYDLLKDFAPVAYLGASPNVVLAGPAAGVADFAELVAKAKANPGKMTYGSPGVGSTPHLAMELIKLKLGLDILHIPFTGLGPAMTAVLGGQTDFSSTTVAGVMGNVRSGKLKPMVQTGTQRWPELPDTPTVGEVGAPGASSETSQMVLVPTGTPQPIIDRLSAEILKIMAKPEVKEKMLTAGFAVKGEGPAQLRQRMEKEIAMWKDVAERAGIRRE